MGDHRHATEGWVYFIQAEGLPRIKIGFTTNVARRMIDLSHASPVKLILLKQVKATLKIEQTLLALFDEYRIHSEWFHADISLIAFINRLQDRSAFSLTEIFVAK